jgi:hypothetical protein
MRQFKLDLIQNDEYHKLLDISPGNIRTIIKNEVAKKCCQRRNTSVIKRVSVGAKQVLRC